MSEQEWRRKEYNTWDEAFRGLAPIIRQQSVRIAEYTQTIYTAACSALYARHSGSEWESRIHGQLAETAYKCGLYHQLGKALVPPEYQIWQKDFSAEETEVYRKYTKAGRLLAAKLQEKGVREKEKRKGTPEEVPTKNIPWLMIRESCEQHMERYNGTGYPDGLAGDNISPIARIVGLAKELDRLSAERRSEHPFEEACETLIGESGTYWDPELIDVFKKCVKNCRAVYDKFVHYTMQIPETIPLVVKREGRPLGLSYRPIISDKKGTVAGYEAIPWFGAIANRPGETESIEDLEEMLKRTGMVSDVSYYFLYEAADTLLRMQTCKLQTNGIVLNMIPSFYKQSSQLQNFETLFEQQPVDRTKLFLTIPESMLVDATKTLEENVSRYLRNGIALLLDNYHPETLEISRIKELGFDNVRLASDTYDKPGIGDTIRALTDSKIRVFCSNVTDEQTLEWLTVCGAEMICGPLAGVTTDEDGLIRDSLFREEQQ
ncbi:MAG: EAL domain-containing protein [Clostridia bacterium]|nr:EAL domain-containing protein [Clostridia bacterium]